MFHRLWRLVLVEPLSLFCKQTVRLQFIHMEESSHHPRGLFQQAGKGNVSSFPDLWALPSLSLLSFLQPHKYCLEMVLTVLGGRGRSGAVSNEPPAPLQQWKCKAPVQTCTLSFPFRQAPQVPLGLEVSDPCLNLCSCTVYLPISWWGVAHSFLSSWQRGTFLSWEQQPHQGALDLAFLLVSVETFEKTLSHSLCHILNGNNVAFLLPKECFEDAVINMYE